jgi:hypothetical protein
VGSDAGEPGACQVRYDRAGDHFSLVDPDPQRCTLGAGAQATVSGTVLTLQAPLSFGAGFEGSHGIFLRAEDFGGAEKDWVQAGSWSVLGPNTPPSAVSVNPATGQGAAQRFEATFADADGGAAIRNVYLAVHSRLDAAAACWVKVDVESRSMRLLDDAGVALSDPVAFGSGRAQNSQCALTGSQAFLVTAGEQLQVGAPLEFSESFVGEKFVFLLAVDARGAVSPWVQAGQWSVPGSMAVPQIESLAPESGSGGDAELTLTLSDANGASNIGEAHLLIGSRLQPGGVCWIRAEPGARLLRLASDDGAVFSGPVAPGGGEQSNSQCTLRGAGAGFVAAGNKLTLQIPLGFAAGFAGTKSIWAFVVDENGKMSGWRRVGDWLIP